MKYRRFAPTKRTAAEHATAVDEMVGSKKVDMAKAKKTLRENRIRRKKLLGQAVLSAKEMEERRLRVARGWWRNRDGRLRIIVAGRVGVVVVGYLRSLKVRVEFPTGNRVTVRLPKCWWVGKNSSEPIDPVKCWMRVIKRPKNATREALKAELLSHGFKEEELPNDAENWKRMIFLSAVSFD